MSNFYARDYKPINGTYKGRGRDYVALLACPVEGAPLDYHSGMLHCTKDATHSYGFEDGILRLAAPDRRAELDAESARHEAQCAAAGWKTPDEDEFKALPQGGLSGYPVEHWPREAARTALLWRFLETVRLRAGKLPVGPMGEAAVIGADNGWLAYGLDVAGFTTVALETHAGDRYGLGVYPIARYLRVQADLVRPPLARGAFDWLIFQDGLTRFGDTAGQRAAFETALRALRPGGWVAVMNGGSGSSNGTALIPSLFYEAGLMMMGTPHRIGWRGALADLRERLAGQQNAPPPVLVAQKPG